jgi:hypothetical protein
MCPGDSSQFLNFRHYSISKKQLIEFHNLQSAICNLQFSYEMVRVSDLGQDPER